MTKLQKVYSAKSASGNAIRGASSSGIGKAAQRIPVVGYALSAAAIPVDIVNAPEGKKVTYGIASTISFAGGVGAAVLGGEIGATVGVLMGLFAWAAIPVFAAIGAAGGALYYEFGRFSDAVKDGVIKGLEG